MRVVKAIQNLFGRRKRERRKYHAVPVDFDGATFYTFEHVRNMPTTRFLSIVDTSNELEVGITRETLDAFCVGLEREIENREWARAAYYVQMLRMFREQFTSPEIMFKICNAIVLLPDEPVAEFDPKFTAIKRRMYDSDPEVRRFFLECVVPRLSELMSTWQTLTAKDLNEAMTGANRESMFLLNLTRGISSPQNVGN